MLYNIVFSPTGGTKKIADIVSKELSENISVIDLTQVNMNFSDYQLQKGDIAVIAMPSYGGRAPQVAMERLKQIKSNNVDAILICAYGNRAYEDTLAEMQDAAQDIGFNVIAAISAITEHSIVRLYGSGRPDNNDEKTLREFVLKIKERISNSDYTTIKITGNKPYKKIQNVGLIPKTTKDCVNCKKCAEMCPTGAISNIDVKRIDKNKCISCMRCVSICNKQAKKLSKIITGIISFVLKKECCKRKENELF